MTFRILSPAHNEIVAATTYLEKQSGLGGEFLGVVYSTFDDIEADFNAFPQWEMNPLDAEIRRVILKRFRYVIYYQIVHDEIVVLAVCHGSRDFGTWLKRVQQRDPWSDQQDYHQQGGNET